MCLRIIAVAVIFFSGLPVIAQNRNSKVFDPIEPTLQPHLSDRLKLFVEYNRTQQWDKLYDLTYKPDIKNITREQFVKRQRLFSGKGASRTIAFTPQATQKSPEGITDNFLIEGCLKVNWKGRNHRWRATVDAYFVEGEWYFTGIFTVVAGTDMPPQPCLSAASNKSWDASRGSMFRVKLL
jgi:hypothetical protein